MIKLGRTIEGPRRYRIESAGNGLFYTVTRLSDAKTLFFQGDDAVSFDWKLENTHAGYTKDQVCDEYESLFE